MEFRVSIKIQNSKFLLVFYLFAEIFPCSLNRFEQRECVRVCVCVCVCE